MIRKQIELYPLIHYISMSFIFNWLIASMLCVYYVYLPMI